MRDLIHIREGYRASHSMSIPHLFRCPISLDLFTDPVTLSTGQTYDRLAIEKWLSHGNRTCPVTMQRLHDASLVPNRTLRTLIDQWLVSIPDQKTRLEESKAGSGTACSLASLKRRLESSIDTEVSTKLEILKKVGLLSTESDIAHACLIQLGYFPLLLQMMFGSTTSSSKLLDDDDDSQFIEVGLDCVLCLLNPTQLDSLNLINIASFVLLLHQGNVKIKTNLCYLLESITTSDSTQELALTLGKTKPVLQTVVSLLHTRTDCRAPDAAVRAVSGFCSTEANMINAVREGAVDGLISYLMNPSCNCSSVALATLEVLVGFECGKKAAIKNQNAVGVLVKSVFRVSSPSGSSSSGSSSSSCSMSMSMSENGEHAVGVLLVVCRESARARKEAVSGGVVTQVLLMLQSQYCEGRGKEKARALLKLLMSMWGRGYPAGIGDNFYCLV